jgi:hypothetical protein
MKGSATGRDNKESFNGRKESTIYEQPPNLKAGGICPGWISTTKRNTAGC